ncbi:MAG: response regulator [Rhodospirillaceae bacterium]|nr:response regulator [Rhodospirillaceae bacterium]MDE0617247.1 response regulator [Rhodospirillaceae bacterium]
MNDTMEPEREIEALRERISALSSAVLRINASLDVATVLQEAVDSARALTGARYGLIATTDEEGEVQDFVSSGFTDAEHREFVEWSDGPRLFAHLRDLPGPIRLADLPAFVRSLGFSPDLMRSKTFQGTPMRHRGKQVGNFFLAEKEAAPEFTEEDEEVLVLFAAQAATAIANARAHRDERQARADLEALVETSPVGVVVFDARSGRPVLVNREARRIVEGVRTAGRPVEELLEVMSFRRADGRELSLSELSIADLLSIDETVRAEEIVFMVPDGRSVRTLLNSTPIHSDGGEVASVVVTIQDLAPIEELERLRAEFLGLVSHELRAPLTAIKGSAATLLESSAELDSAEQHEFHRIIHDQADHMRALIGDLLDAGRIEAGTLSVAPERSELATLVDRARTTFLSGGGRHTVLIDLPRNLPPVMADRRRIVQVLNNLLSNAAQHSPESAPIRVSAARDGVHVAVAVSDGGRGIAPERLPQLFRKYAGAAAGGERAIADTGLGLVICRGLVEAHGGRIRAESGGAGQGARFTFTLPVARSAGPGEAADPAADPQARSPDTREASRILVVDDDPLTLRFVRDALTAAGYVTLVTGDHADLSQVIRTEKPRLVMLDLMLPGTDGIELMESVPELGDLPVIFISGYGRDETVARALDAGAVDYIVKPFSPTELTARVGAALRRIARPEPFSLGTLAIRYEARRVTVAGRPVTLTATEYELLRILSLNAGRVVTYDTLLRRVWSGRESGDLDLVRNFIKKLRAKLGEKASKPTWIFNERGIGYRMPRPGGE